MKKLDVFLIPLFVAQGALAGTSVSDFSNLPALVAAIEADVGYKCAQAQISMHDNTTRKIEESIDTETRELHVHLQQRLDGMLSVASSRRALPLGIRVTRPGELEVAQHID